MKKIRTKEEQAIVREDLYDFLRDELDILNVQFKKEEDDEWKKVVMYTDNCYINSTQVQCFVDAYKKFLDKTGYGWLTIDYYIDLREVLDEHGTKRVVAVIEADVIMDR